MSVVRSSFIWVVPALLSVGCTNEVGRGPRLGSDEGTEGASRPDEDTARAATNGAATTSMPASACDNAASWSARRDFAFAGDGEFVAALNGLAAASDVAPMAVSSHIDPNCVWRVAFSALAGTSENGLAHPTTFAPMLRHPAGLWTAAPQSAGWLRFVDRASRVVWLPIESATGSATYGESSCSTLAAVHVTATIPASAADVSLVTEAGTRTVRELMATSPGARGWSVSLGFSADLTR